MNTEQLILSVGTILLAARFLGWIFQLIGQPKVVGEMTAGIMTVEQRLKASCPFLFAYNGKEMEFVKDAVPWGAAIGLRINTLGAARVATTVEWYKIGREQLVPRNGYYDIRIGAELWETYYYDYLALMAVDHPVGTEIFVDERFVIPPQKPGFTVVETPHKIAHAKALYPNSSHSDCRCHRSFGELPANASRGIFGSSDCGSFESSSGQCATRASCAFIGNRRSHAAFRAHPVHRRYRRSGHSLQIQQRGFR